MLAFMGVLTQIDGNSLERYCETFVRWREMRDFLREQGYIQYNLRSGEEKLRPQVNLEIKLNEILTRMESKFGLDPSSRANMVAQLPVKKREEI